MAADDNRKIAVALLTAEGALKGYVMSLVPIRKIIAHCDTLDLSRSKPETEQNAYLFFERTM